MARTKYGKYFTTKRGRYGRYKYVNGKRVGFVGSSTKSRFIRHYKKQYKKYGHGGRRWKSFRG